MNGGPPGDLYLRVRLVPHPRYRVVGDDLEMDLPLWPWQAVLGGEVKIDTPDGPVTLKVPAGHAERTAAAAARARAAARGRQPRRPLRGRADRRARAAERGGARGLRGAEAARLGAGRPAGAA